MRPPLYIGATTLKVPWKGVFEVERWKGGMVEWWKGSLRCPEKGGLK
jgi:hypothetical protein